MTLRSTSFVQDATLDEQFTCDGTDISPQLQWENAPKGTKSFAIIADDPDAVAVAVAVAVTGYT